MSRHPSLDRRSTGAARILTCLVAAAISLALAGAVAPAAIAQTELYAYWSTHAAAEGDYDLVCDLDSLGVYTGSLYLTEGTNLIRGHGAILDLGGGIIRVVGSQTRLDVTDCVIMDGGVVGVPERPALSYAGLTRGHVANCVFYANRTGLQMEEVFHTESSIRNCIFLLNEGWGCIVDPGYVPEIAHCCAHRNGELQPPGEGGHYTLWCGCSSVDPVVYEPPAGSHCMVDDPLFAHPSLDPAECDLHLTTGSPCIGAGDPPGTHIGAYQEVVTPVASASWGRIKQLYR
jgi:hypothetical protein